MGDNMKDKETKTVNGVKCIVTCEWCKLTSEKIDMFNKLLVEKAVKHIGGKQQ